MIVTKLEAVTASASGVPFWPLFLFRYQQGLGAYIGLFLVMLLVVRKQIAGAFRDFFKPGELKPFAPGKWTLVVFCGGVCLLPVVFTQAGIALWFAVFLALLLFVSVLVMARLRAQSGVPMIYLHIVEARSFVWLIGGGTLAAAGESTVAGLIFVSFLLRCSYLTPYQSDGFHISEETGFGYRRWIILSMLAVIVGFVLATVFQLSAIYEYGFNNLKQRVLTYPANQIVRDVKSSTALDPIRTTIMGAGLLTTGVLTLLQLAYYWFPLTPVGFVVGCAIGDYVG